MPERRRRGLRSRSRAVVWLQVAQIVGLVGLVLAALYLLREHTDDTTTAAAPQDTSDAEAPDDTTTNVTAAPFTDEPRPTGDEAPAADPSPHPTNVTVVVPPSGPTSGSPHGGPAPSLPPAPPADTAPNPTTDTTTRTPPTTSPRTTPPTSPTTDTTQPPSTQQGTVNGCNTYGVNCDGNPIYAEVPPPGWFDWAAWPTIAHVDNGTVLTARCWAIGGLVYNYRIDPPDHGPDPYASDTYFNVQAPDGRWGWIPDTWYVRDQGNRMGLPRCPANA